MVTNARNNMASVNQRKPISEENIDIFLSIVAELTSWVNPYSRIKSIIDSQRLFG